MFQSIIRQHILHLLTGRLAQQRQQADIMLDPPPQGLVLNGHTLGSKQFVHLFERTTFRFGNQEPDVQHADGGDAAEKDERAVARGFDEGGRG